jgi:hypothetical protein
VEPWSSKRNNGLWGRNANEKEKKKEEKKEGKVKGKGKGERKMK